MKDKDNIFKFLTAIIETQDYKIDDRLSDNVWYIASKRVFIAMTQAIAAYWKLSKQEALKYKLPTKGKYIASQIFTYGDEILLEESEVYGLYENFGILRNKNIIGSRWSLGDYGLKMDEYKASLIGQLLSRKAGTYISHDFLKLLTIPENTASFNKVFVPAPDLCHEDPFLFISKSKQLRFYVMGMHYNAFKKV